MSIAASYKERVKWFHEARFGIFIHWGLYSILGRGEWVMETEKIPYNEYKLLADQFNPDKCDMDKWVQIAKDAGARYMVFTARHHDGFCLFDSKVSDFTSVKTAARRDFVSEYVRACRKTGLKVGLYYSWLDWRFPGYFDREKYPDSFSDMVKQAHAQIEELMTNYGMVDILWLDGQWFPDTTSDDLSIKENTKISDLWNAKEILDRVRDIQPGILINNRSGLAGDLDTPEQRVVASEPGRAWESCMTIGDHVGWGYIKNNPNLKTNAELIQSMVKAASGEGNFLLNIGPKPDGTIQNEFVERLRFIGKWLNKNGESIYGSQCCAIGGGIIGITTAKENKAYIHVFRWPGREACIADVAPEVDEAYILQTGQKVDVSYKSNGRLNLSGMPEQPPDPYDTVIVLKFYEKPRSCITERVI